jgi:hypothetical protein
VVLLNMVQTPTVRLFMMKHVIKTMQLINCSLEDRDARVIRLQH